MTMTDPIADMLTRIRNAQHRDATTTCACPRSKLKEALAGILQQEGYIEGFDVADDHRPSRSRSSTIRMKYSPDRARTISGLRRVSKPGLRVYSQSDKLPRVLGGLGVAVLSTSQGLMTDREARKRRRRRRGPLLRLVRSERHVPHRQATHPRPLRRRRHHRRSPRHREGPQGHPRAATSPSPSPSARTATSSSSSAPTTSARAGPCTAWPARSSTTWSSASPTASPRSSRSSASATAPPPPSPHQARPGPRLQPPGRRRRPRRASPSRCPTPTRIVVAGHRQGGGRPGRRQHPQDPQARALQGQGRPVPRRARRCARPARQASKDRHDRQRSKQASRPRSAATAGSARRSRARPTRPRLAVFRSNKHIVAQVIDDRAGARWPRRRPSRPTCASGATGNNDAATKVGRLVAERAKAAGVDRSSSTAAATSTTAASRPLADAARAAGLEF